MKNLWKSITMWLTTTGILIFTLVDENSDAISFVLSDFLPYTIDVINEYVVKYNKILLIITLFGTGYGRIRTDKVDTKLSDRIYIKRYKGVK